LKAAYRDCIPFLTIQKDLDISESEDFKRIKQQNETLILEAEKHRVERQELQELKGKLDTLEKEQAQMKQFSDIMISLSDRAKKNMDPRIKIDDDGIMRIPEDLFRGSKDKQETSK
jgi:hypothetical protein